MSEHEEVHLDVDPMLFLAAVIEQELEGIAASAGLAALMPEMAEGVADICRGNIERAQAELDRLITEDETWHDPH